MKRLFLFAGLFTSLALVAAEPNDFAQRWPVLGSCQAGVPGAIPAMRSLSCEGAFALTLDESVYRQVGRADLSDLAAFNGAGEALPFGPMPAAYTPPPAAWMDAAWFALPPAKPGQYEDLHLHVTRSGAGELSLDASLSRQEGEGVRNFLIDVRAKDRLVDAIAVDFPTSAPDFIAEVAVAVSDDLQIWRTIVSSAKLAQLRQGGQTLLRKQIEFAPQSAAYLRLQTLDGSTIPVTSVRLQSQPAKGAWDSARSVIAADFVRREGRAYVYWLPARVPVERINIALGDDNAIASFSISAREAGQKHWSYIGQLDAFRLRGAGTTLDNEAMDVPRTREREWRIEANRELARTPRLELSYRPETWILLTHGAPPYSVAAGSGSSRRDAYPLDALVAQVRTRFGAGWQPWPASLGAMNTAGGAAALSAYDPEDRRTWLLWGVLVLAAAAIIIMVLRLLKSPADS